MPRYTSRRKSYKTTTLPTKEKRTSKSYYARRLNSHTHNANTSAYTNIASYKTAINILATMGLRTILIAKIHSNLKLQFTLLAYCYNNNADIELWEVYISGKLIESRPYKAKDSYMDAFIKDTYNPLLQQLLKTPPTHPVVAPGILFRPLIEVRL